MTTMRSRAFLFFLAACGGAVEVPATTAAPVASSSVAASVSAIATSDAPEVSPFQAAVDVEAAVKKADAVVADQLAAQMRPRLDPFFALVKRGDRASAFGTIALDSTRASLATVATVGAAACGGVVARFCPSQNFAAPITSRDPALAEPSITGYFASDKLYALDVTFPMPGRSLTKEEQRSAIAAFESIATHAFGAPTSVRREPNDDITPPYETTLVYGDTMIIRHARGGSVTVSIQGASRDLEAALVKRDETLVAAEMAARAEAERKELCKCRHVRVGDVWPHDAPMMMQHTGGGLETRYRILSVSPATCNVRVENISPMFGGNRGQQPYDMSCTQFIEPHACDLCGISR